VKILVKTKIGDTDYQFDIDEKDEMEALHIAAVLGNPPNYCHECKNNQFFKLDSNKDKDGNTYVNVVCRKCGAKAKLGLYKAGGFFWHKFEKYIKPGSEETSHPVDKIVPPIKESDNNDLPF